MKDFEFFFIYILKCDEPVHGVTKKKEKCVKLRKVEDDMELLGKLGADLNGESSNCGAFPSVFFLLFG